MTNLFIKHVLGVGQEHIGAFSETSSYYGAVEQQGRLTLHLHVLLWIRNALSPQEICSCIMDPTSAFCKELFAYLEASHQGDYFNGSQKDVLQSLSQASRSLDFKTPLEVMPEPPLQPCPILDCFQESCTWCQWLSSWWAHFQQTVDFVVAKTHIHLCGDNTNADGTRKKNQYDSNETTIDAEGHITMKKHEAWINTFLPLLTYLFHCNTDVTSLWSGTAIKAVISYVSDYVTKPSLKTHAIFEAIRSVFERNTELLSSGET
ncbi:hypothetical protein ARMGADRAFT_927716 [Armillaria gallica]|uniref:Helitron helicase-like domain-containing protein n=1 Tax=Armillaria gallica TaxID=47427 RepID=A0A2H3DGS4_ARMGA|nr:hypothetical protein ARMGADRAFT_927716 [Armillaria gallica]